MAQETVSVKLTAEDQLSGVLKQILGSVQNLTGSFQGLSSLASRGLGLAALAGAAAVLANALKDAATAGLAARQENEKFEIQLASLTAKTVGWTSAIITARNSVEALENIEKASTESTESLMQSFARLRLMTGESSTNITDLTKQLALFAKANATTSAELLAMIDKVARGGQLRKGTLIEAKLLEVGITEEIIRQSFLQDKLSQNVFSKLKNIKEVDEAIANSQEVLKKNLEVTTSQVLEQFVQVTGLEKAWKGALGALSEYLAKLKESMDETNPGRKNDLPVSLGPSWYKLFGGGPSFRGAGASATWEPNDKGTNNAAAAALAEANKQWDIFIGKLKQDQRLSGLEGINASIQSIRDKEEAANKSAAEMLKKQFGLTDEQIKNDERYRDARIRNASIASNQITILRQNESEKNRLIALKELIDSQKDLDIQKQKQKRWLAGLAKDKFDTEKLIADFTADAQSDILSTTGNFYDDQAILIERDKNNKIATLKELRREEKIWDEDLEKGTAEYEAQAKRRAEANYRERHTFTAYINELSKSLDYLLNNTNSVAEGVEAGFLKIELSMKSTAQNISDIMLDIFNSISNTLSSTLEALFTGQLSSIQDIFKNFGKSLARIFANALVTEMQPALSALMKQFTTTLGINKPEKGPGGNFYDSQGNVTDRYGNPVNERGESGIPTASGYIAAGTMGYGIGSAFNSQNSQLPSYLGMGAGLAGYGLASAEVFGTVGAGGGIAALGGLSATVVGLVAAVVVAGIAALVIAITKKPTEAFKSISGLDFKRIYEGFAPKDEDIQRVVEARDKMLGGWVDMFRASKSPEGNEFVALLNKQIKDYYSTFLTKKVGAGKPEDLQFDWDTLLNAVLPREALHQLFGQPANGMKDTPGGTNQAGRYDSYVTSAGVLTQFLTSIGFTIGKVQEIANLIDVKAPEEFQKWLTSLVGVVVTFNNVIADMGKSYDEILADVKKEDAKTFIDWMKDGATNIIQLTKDLSSYSGQDQIDHAQTVAQLAAEYFEDQKTYLRQLSQLQQQLLDQITSITERIAAYFTGLDPNSATRTRRGRLFGRDDVGPTATGAYNWEVGLAGSQTPAEMQTRAHQVMQDISDEIDYLLTRIARATEILKANEDLIAGFHDLATGGWKTKEEDIFGYLNDALALQSQVALAATFTGDHQIDALEKIHLTAKEAFDYIQSALQKIAQYSAELSKNVASDIYENNLSLMNPEQQASSFREQIIKLMDSIGTATNPDQIRSATEDIRNFVKRYLSLFSANDPNRAAQVSWANDVFKKMEGLAQGRYTAMGTSMEQASKTVEQLLIDSNELLKDNVEKATTELTILNTMLATLNTTIAALTTKFGTASTVYNPEVMTAFQTALNLFTQAIGGPATTTAAGGTAPHGGNGPLIPEINETATAMSNFRDAVTGATNALGGQTA